MVYSSLVAGVSFGVMSYFKIELKNAENFFNKYVYFDVIATLFLTTILAFFLTRYTDGKNSK